MEKVIVVIGPTSVGKTKMGVALAKKLKGEVISADSMQVYRQIDNRNMVHGEFALVHILSYHQLQDKNIHPSPYLTT